MKKICSEYVVEIDFIIFLNLFCDFHTKNRICSFFRQMIVLTKNNNVRMIKTFTQKFLIYDWTEDNRNEMTDEVVPEVDCLSPSEETITFLKNFARSFSFDMDMDAQSAFPIA